MVGNLRHAEKPEALSSSRTARPTPMRISLHSIIAEDSLIIVELVCVPTIVEVVVDATHEWVILYVLLLHRLEVVHRCPFCGSSGPILWSL